MNGLTQPAVTGVDELVVYVPRNNQDLASMHLYATSS